MGHTSSGEDRIGFRLSKEPLERLDAVAAAAGVSRHQAARELLVLSLMAEGQRELLPAIASLAEGIGGLQVQVDELIMQQIRLTYNLAAAIEWLSLMIADPQARAIDPERLHEVVTALFFEEDPEVINFSQSQEVRRA